MTTRAENFDANPVAPGPWWEEAAARAKCPTPCDFDCEADCHQFHVPYWKRVRTTNPGPWDHETEDCPSIVVPRLVRVIRTITEMHAPDENAAWCTGCDFSWPCRTVRAIADGETETP